MSGIDTRNGGSLASRRAMFESAAKSTNSGTTSYTTTFRRMPAPSHDPTEEPVEHKLQEIPPSTQPSDPISQTSEQQPTETPIKRISSNRAEPITEQKSVRSRNSKVITTRIKSVRDNPFLQNDRKRRRRKFSLGAPKDFKPQPIREQPRTSIRNQVDHDESKLIGRGHKRRSSKIKSPPLKTNSSNPPIHELSSEDDHRSVSPEARSPKSPPRESLSRSTPPPQESKIDEPPSIPEEVYRPPSPPPVTDSFTNHQISSQFGQPLDDLEYVRLPRYPSPIPRILIELKKRFHAADGVLQPDIFMVDPESKADQHHTIAALIKSWFAELPRPLMLDVKPNAINAAMNKKLVPAALEKMPVRVAAILSWLWDLCADVDENSSVNGVDANKLSRVFGPIMITVTRRDIRGPRASVNALYASRLIVFMKRGILWRRMLREE